MLEDCRNADASGTVRSVVEPSDVRRAVETRADGRQAEVEVALPMARRGDSVRAWSDAELVTAVRGEPVDAAALDALVERYWAPLHARCELLTLDRESARDLAQETWLRLLRARASLQPESNFAGYLMTIATNLCRDRQRSARRAGALSDARIASLDTASSDADDLVLANVVAEPGALPRDEQLLLRIDLDRALATLTPRMREVLVARYVDGESAAEIGARFGRTEQTITSWLRQALRDLRAAFPSSGDA